MTAVGTEADLLGRGAWAPPPAPARVALRERIRAGLTAIAVAEDDGGGPLAAGTHHSVGDVTEITSVGTLPAARGRGIGAALTGHLVGNARERGAALVFLSAADDAVARMYERLGFRRIGTACFGRPPEP